MTAVTIHASRGEFAAGTFRSPAEAPLCHTGLRSPQAVPGRCSSVPEGRSHSRRDKELPLFGVAVVGMFVVAPVPGKDVEVRKATRRLDPWTSVPRPVALARRDVEDRPPPDRGGSMIA